MLVEGLGAPGSKSMLLMEERWYLPESWSTRGKPAPLVGGEEGGAV